MGMGIGDWGFGVGGLGGGGPGAPPHTTHPTPPPQTHTPPKKK